MVGVSTDVRGIGVSEPAGILRKHEKSLRQEWYFVQFVTPGVGAEITLIEEDPWKEFQMALFHVADTHMQVWEVTKLPVKQSGLDFPDLNLSTPKNWTLLSIWWPLFGSLCISRQVNTQI